MRILLLTETLWPGGAETFVVRLANALAADGNDVMIAVMHGELVHPALAAKIDARVAVDALTLPAKRTLQRADRILRALRIDLPLIHILQRRWLGGIVERWKPEVVHSHLVKADWLAAEVKTRSRGFRHVLTLHGDFGPFLHGQADPQMIRLRPRISSILKGADAIVGVCQEHVAFIADQFPAAARKTSLIYNGLAASTGHQRMSASAPGEPFRFGMVSRGVEGKGWAKAIEAFELLNRESSELVLVGDGAFLDKLKASSLPEAVKFAGFAPDPVEHIRRFEVCLLPTEFPHESLPTVVMEYLSAGKPVIATDVGEIGMMLQTPEGDLAGTLLSFEEQQVSSVEMAAAMRAYLDDAQLRTRHAARASAAFAKFDMAACVAAYGKLYRGEP